ncbi:MAG: DUF2497 domain-containing protein [Neomegalonema sp.]|nr:DUF2497 domain-containing protein [Neomegalonema sp.]
MTSSPPRKPRAVRRPRRPSVYRSNQEAVGGYGFDTPGQAIEERLEERRRGAFEDQEQIETMLDSIKRIVRKDIGARAEAKAASGAEAILERSRKVARQASADAEEAAPPPLDPGVDISALADALVSGALQLSEKSELEEVGRPPSLAAVEPSPAPSESADGWDEFADLMRKADAFLADDADETAQQPGAERAADGMRDMMERLKTTVDFGAVADSQDGSSLAEAPAEAPLPEHREPSALARPEAIGEDLSEATDAGLAEPIDEEPVEFDVYADSFVAAPFLEPGDTVDGHADLGDVEPPAYAPLDTQADVAETDDPPAASEGALSAQARSDETVAVAAPAIDPALSDDIQPPSYAPASVEASTGEGAQQTVAPTSASADMPSADDVVEPPAYSQPQEPVSAPAAPAAPTDQAESAAPAAEPSAHSARARRTREPVEEIFTLPPTLKQKDALQAIGDLVKSRAQRFVDAGVQPGKMETPPIKEIADKVGDYRPAGEIEPPQPSQRERVRALLMDELKEGYTPAPVDEEERAALKAPAAAPAAGDADKTRATLTAWLHANLPRLVEEMVRDQVDRLSEDNSAAQEGIGRDAAPKKDPSQGE